MHMLVIVEYAHCTCNIEAVSIFERNGIYGIDDALQNQSCPMN